MLCLPGGDIIPPMTVPELNKLIKKRKRFGFLPPNAPDAAALAWEADDRLFKAVLSDSNHVLWKYSPNICAL